ncbi:MAG TPA: COX15/CtaA family protein, partial [Blastocatellia bacterium]
FYMPRFTDFFHRGVAYKDVRSVHRIAILLVCLTVLLLVAGALVTSNEAGDSVPDWPMSFGRWLVGSRQFVGNVRYEYSHRVVAGTVGSVTLLVALVIWGREKLRSSLGWLALAALLGVIFQAGLGGVRVLFPAYKVPIAVVHAFIAQSFFCLVVCLALVTSASWNARAGDRPRPAKTGSLPVLTSFALVVVLVQLVLGAGYRHGAFPIGWHIAGAIAVLLVLLATAAVVYKDYSKDAYLMRPALLMCGFLLLQIGLGIAAYMARLASVDDPQPLEPMVSLTVAHVVVGALTLAVVLVLTLRCHQVIERGASAESIGVQRSIARA